MPLFPAFIFDLIWLIVFALSIVVLLAVLLSHLLSDLVSRFLQSATSNLILAEKEAIAEHCISTIACLLSGMEFLRQQQGSTRYIRVVKRIHGLHVYLWTEYLL